MRMAEGSIPSTLCFHNCHWSGVGSGVGTHSRDVMQASYEVGRMPLRKFCVEGR